MYDAPFGLSKADSFTLHHNSEPNYIRGQAAQPLFDDTKQYFDPELPNHGVKLPAAWREDPRPQRGRHVDAGPRLLTLV